MSELQPLYEAVLAGDHKRARQVAEQALAEKVDPQSLVTDYMIPAMDEVGRRYEANEYFVSELLIAARAMKAALEPLRPLLAERRAEPAGRVVIGTVRGDLHDIGKNLVSAMLEGAGFEVTDLGVDVPPERFVAAAREHRADLVALSALLTTTMHAMRGVVDAVKASGLEVKVIVGGAPVTRKYAEEIGADGYSASASGAVSVAREFLAEV